MTTSNSKRKKYKIVIYPALIVGELILLYVYWQIAAIVFCGAVYYIALYRIIVDKSGEVANFWSNEGFERNVRRCKPSISSNISNTINKKEDTNETSN